MSVYNNDTPPEKSAETPEKSPVPEAPDSILSKSATYYDELERRTSNSLDFVDLKELEMRIGLLARIILEHHLRSKILTPRDKCDIALRAITTLEGSKQEVVWRDELMKKPTTKSLQAYKAERLEREERLKTILLRKKEVQVARAEEALKELERKNPPAEDTN